MLILLFCLLFISMSTVVIEVCKNTQISIGVNITFTNSLCVFFFIKKHTPFHKSFKDSS